MKELKDLSNEERGRELGVFSLEKRRLRDNLTNAYKYLQGDIKKMEPGSFQLCPVTGPEAMHTNGNTVGSLWPSGNTSHVRVTERWHRLPREIAESPPLEKFKGHPGIVLGNLL